MLAFDWVLIPLWIIGTTGVILWLAAVCLLIADLWKGR